MQSCYQLKMDYFIYKMFHVRYWIGTSNMKKHHKTLRNMKNNVPYGNYKAKTQTTPLKNKERGETEHNTTKTISPIYRGRQKQKNGRELQKSSKNVKISSYISELTLNINGLNSPIKIH